MKTKLQFKKLLLFKWTFTLVVFVFALRCFEAVQAEIYSDEVVYSFLYGRYWLDGPKIPIVYPQCFPPGFSLPLSFVQHFSFSILSALLVPIESPYLVRWLPFFFFLLFLMGPLVWVYGVSRRRHLVGLTACTFLVLASIPPVPRLLVFFRPEWMYLGSTSLAVGVLFCSAKEFKFKKWMLLFCGVLGIFALGLHANSMFFVPIVFFGILKRLESALLRICLGLTMVMLLVDQGLSIKLWSSCPQDHILSGVLQNLTILPLFRLPQFGLTEVLASAYSVLDGYVFGFPERFFNQYGWHGLPPLEGSIIVLKAALIFLLFGTFGMWVSFRKKVSTKIKRWFVPALFSLFCLTGLLFYRDAKFYYLPLLIASAFWCVSLILPLVVRDAFRVQLFKWLLLVVLFGTLWAFPLRGTGLSQENVPWLTGQYLSTQQKDRIKIERDISAVLSKCKLGPEPWENLVIDDWTYFPLRSRLRNPVHAFYVSRSTYAARIYDLELFLTEIGSRGIVARCREFEMRKGLFEKMSREGDLCCLKISK